MENREFACGSSRRRRRREKKSLCVLLYYVCVSVCVVVVSFLRDDGQGRLSQKDWRGCSGVIMEYAIAVSDMASAVSVALYIPLVPSPPSSSLSKQHHGYGSSTGVSKGEKDTAAAPRPRRLSPPPTAARAAIPRST